MAEDERMGGQTTPHLTDRQCRAYRRTIFRNATSLRRTASRRHRANSFTSRRAWGVRRAPPRLDPPPGGASTLAPSPPPLPRVGLRQGGKLPPASPPPPRAGPRPPPRPRAVRGQGAPGKVPP